MHWLLFAAVNVLAFSVASLYQKLAMKEDASDAVISSIIFQFLLSGFSAIVALFMGFHIPPLSFWPYLLSAALLYALGTLFGFRAIKIIEASEMSILSGAGVIVTIIISFFFLHERLTIMQLTGAALVLLAILLVKYERRTFKINKGTGFALLGTACYGLAVTFDAFMLKSFDVFSYIPIMSFLPGVLLIIMYPKKIPVLFGEIKKINGNLIIYSFLYVVGALSFYVPIHNGTLVSQMSVVGRVTIVLTVVLAAIFLKERSHVGKKILGAILTTVGIFLIR